MEFKTAARIKLFDENGKAWYQDGIVNADDTSEQFNTVGKGYTIVQHEEVVSKVNEALDDKNLEAVTRFEETQKGARIRMELTFKDIELDVEDNGQKVALRCFYDNSYDGTTGLRLEVGAKSPYGDGFLWFGQTYYHRHTKGVRVSELEKKLEKGISVFQDKIKKHFKEMFKTSVTQDQVANFLQEAIDDKKFKGSNKHLKVIAKNIKAANIKNKWQVYCLICDTLSTYSDDSGKISLENRDRQLSLIIPRLHKKIQNDDRPATTSEIVDYHTSKQVEIEA